MSLLRDADNQLQQLPRALRWAIYAAAGLVLFFVWDQWIAPLTEQWKERADAIQGQVTQVRDGADLIHKFDLLDDEIAAIGAVELPADETQGRQAIQEMINTILRKYVVSDQRFSIADGRVRRGTLASVTGTRRLESLKVDLDYTAAPDQAMAIIADLESSPDIEFIRMVRMNKAPGQKIKVRLTFETWVLGSRS